MTDCKMHRDITKLNVGDYIGDSEDFCWRVDSITDKEYTVTDIFHNVTKTILREKRPAKCCMRDYDKYISNYHFLRPYNHSDIINYPISSKWKCTKDCGLNNTKKDTVQIVHYAYSENVFWVCNTKKPFIVFIANAAQLRPIKNKENKHG